MAEVKVASAMAMPACIAIVAVVILADSPIIGRERGVPAIMCVALSIDARMVHGEASLRTVARGVLRDIPVFPVHREMAIIVRMASPVPSRKAEVATCDMPGLALVVVSRRNASNMLVVRIAPLGTAEVIGDQAVTIVAEDRLRLANENRIVIAMSAGRATIAPTTASAVNVAIAIS
jgi:hypothetical protein